MTLNCSANERPRKEKNLSALNQSKPVIPAWLIWIQCIAFVVLYAVWILPEIVGFRNTALVIGALAGLYPIYQYRTALCTKRAIPIWLIVALFAWATFHLLFLSHDYTAQLLEYKRIWKYAAIGAIFAFGLGLSLISTSNAASINGDQVRVTPYWGMIFFGLSTPVLIYLLKYVVTTYGPVLGIQAPAYLQIYHRSQDYYIPKTDYVAFCLPLLAVALSRVQKILTSYSSLMKQEYLTLALYLAAIVATLFLFYSQNTKNGIVYATLCIVIFVLQLLNGGRRGKVWQKLLLVFVCMGWLMAAIYLHAQKNDSWRLFMADAKIALQTTQYQQWKYSGAQGYPNNEFGQMVSPTNYDRMAWSIIGLQLAIQNPFGYGLVEDSFKKMSNDRWPESSPNLSHSHSGWLDLILAVGFPGFICIISALLMCLVLTNGCFQPWKDLVGWVLVSNAMLWITTEVAATVTLPALIFWICLSAGLIFPKIKL